jgi:hydroxymethylbilane synthase
MSQAREVAARLRDVGFRSELVPMVTSGDRGAHASSSPAGLKGLFVAEIVRALQEGEVDLAVHSAKDLPAEDPDGVIVAAIPERASPWDVLIGREGPLETGATVGTSSLRRRGQLLRSRPFKVVDVRGNVDTRVRKMNEGAVDGLVLAQAGLARLGVVPMFAETLSSDAMVPAPGQGAIAVQARTDVEVRDVAARIDHRPSHLAFEAERALVGRLGGGCALPLGALAQVSDGEVHLTAVVIRPDGSGMVRAESVADGPETAAREVADVLLAQGAKEIMQELT